MSTKAELISSRPLISSAPRAALSQSIVAGTVALVDAVVTSALGFIIYFSYVAEPEKTALYVTAIGGFTIVMLLAFNLGGLYRFSMIIAPRLQAARIITICCMLFLALVACAFAVKVSNQYSRIWAFSWLSSTIFAITFARYTVAMLVRRLAKAGILGRTIVIYGADRQGEQLLKHIEKQNEPWNRIAGVFDDRFARLSRRTESGLPILGNLEDLVLWSRMNRVDEVLIALPWSAQSRILALLNTLAKVPANIRMSPEFVGTDLFHRPTNYQFGVPMLSILEKPVAGWGAMSKIVMDYSLGAVFTILSLPLMAVVAAAIKIESKGPVFFRQPRYGFNNQLIEVLKFRTMHSDQQDTDANRLTERGDPRVTRVGNFLRKSSLDELPQLFNVLRGEMSLVGPRPHAIMAKAGGKLYEDVVAHYAVRHKVKPGITGWAQINGWRGNTETEGDLVGRLQHDIYYIENWSILFDLSIIMKTFGAVISGNNSY